MAEVSHLELYTIPIPSEGQPLIRWGDDFDIVLNREPNWLELDFDLEPEYFSLFAGLLDEYSKPDELAVYRSAEYLNQLLLALGYVPGESAFKYVDCSRGGEISSFHFVEHLARYEAPRATELTMKSAKDVEFFDPDHHINHDRQLRVHSIGWMLLTKRLQNLIVEEAREIVHCEGDGPAVSERIDQLATATDKLTGSAYEIGVYALENKHPLPIIAMAPAIPARAKKIIKVLRSFHEIYKLRVPAEFHALEIYGRALKMRKLTDAMRPSF